MNENRFNRNGMDEQYNRNRGDLRGRDEWQTQDPQRGGYDAERSFSGHDRGRDRDDMARDWNRERGHRFGGSSVGAGQDDFSQHRDRDWDYVNRFQGQGDRDFDRGFSGNDRFGGQQHGGGGNMFGGNMLGGDHRGTNDYRFGNDQRGMQRQDHGRSGSLGGGMSLGHRGKGPKGYTRSDDRICDEINDRLTDHDDIDASEIQIEVKNGEVTLSGTVEQRYLKHQIEQLVDGVSGVKDITNQLRVVRAGADQTMQSRTEASRGEDDRKSTGARGNGGQSKSVS